MTPRELLDAFDVLVEAPNGIARLREMVLQLAVRGKLVPQDPTEEPASAVLERVLSVRTKWFESTELRAPKPSKPLKTTPFDVPAGWSWTQLGRECLVEMGNSPPGVSYNDSNDGVPLINGPVEFSPMPLGPTRRIKFTTSPTKMCQRGDLLVCVRGATTGRTNIAAFDACIGRGVALVRGWEAQEWIYLFMRYVGAELLALGKGTTFPSISYDDLAGKPLPVPPLGEQTRIVARVDELMALIDRFEQARLRRESARVAFRDASLAALRDSGTNEGSAASWQFVAGNFDDIFATSTDCAAIHESVVHLALRGRLTGRTRDDSVVTTERYNDYRWPTPSDWRWVSLADVAGRIVDGAHHTPTYVDQGVPFISAKNIDGGRVSFDGCRQIPRGEYEALAKRCRPTVGDVLVTKSGSIGRVAVVTDDIEFTLFESVALVPVKPEVDPRYLALVIEAQVAGRFGAAQTKGAAVKHLHLKDLRTLPVPLPPLDTQRAIVQRLEEITHLVHAVATRLSASLVTAEATAAAFNFHSPQG